MPQLVEWSLLTTEVGGSNPVIGKFYIVNCFEKTKIKKKRPGMAHLQKNIKLDLTECLNAIKLFFDQLVKIKHMLT